MSSLASPAGYTASLLQSRVNLSATCCQAAPLVAFAASLENQLVKIYQTAARAASPFNSNVEEYFPIYEIAISLVVTSSRDERVVTDFARSLNAALSQYASYIRPDLQEDSYLAAGLCAQALYSEILVIIPFLSHVSDAYASFPLPKVGLVIAIAARLDQFIAAYVVSDNVIMDLRAAGVYPSLVPLAAIIQNPKTTAVSDGNNAMQRSAISCAALLRSILSYSVAPAPRASEVAIQIGNQLVSCCLLQLRPRRVSNGHLISLQERCRRLQWKLEELTA